ncbi:hypothetical protein Pmani_012076 [Petrolisthes manimaculis]|uniref:Uncharacterized protein n=1 Tax=Petrolisthes manimaculis TaxID=1843537 RepID=A0AAE1PYU7_9EUCA|nr:hypothetical protein Pmani_012076 [Petrolisthes manimaculis]
MSLLDYIDRDLANRDTELAAAILEFEGIHVLTLSYLHLQMKKKGRKGSRVTGHFRRQRGRKPLHPLLQEFARGVLLIFLHGGADKGLLMVAGRLLPCRFRAETVLRA